MTKRLQTRNCIVCTGPTSLDCLQKFAMHAHALDARMDAVTLKIEMFIFAALSYNNSLEVWFYKNSPSKLAAPISCKQFLSSPIACVACERTELLRTEVTDPKMVMIFLIGKFSTLLWYL